MSFQRVKQHALKLKTTGFARGLGIGGMAGTKKIIIVTNFIRTLNLLSNEKKFVAKGKGNL